MAMLRAGGDRWQDVLGQAQRQLARAVLAAVAAGRLGRAAYQQWLAVEYALCRIDQGALSAIAHWHRPQSALHSAALAWAAALGEQADQAANDIRSLDGIASEPLPQLEAWSRFVDAASGSTRAGETLGAVALHACLMQGAAVEAVAVVRSLPFASGTAGGHLLCRSLPGTASAREARESLLQAYSATALAVGAQRAATWHQAALAGAFTTGP
jgi:hypothetical protein